MGFLPCRANRSEVIDFLISFLQYLARGGGFELRITADFEVLSLMLWA